MECTGRVVAVSEPNAPNIVAVKYQKSGDSPDLRRLARDIIRWECRPYPSIQPPPLAYFIKIFGPSGSTLPMFRQYHSLCLSHWRCPNAKQGLCNDRVSVCPSIVSPSFCLSVPSIHSSSCVWSVCCWAPPPPGRKKAYRSKAAGSGVAYQLSIGISWRRPCSAAHAGSVMLRADGRGSTHTCSSLQRALHYSNLSSLTRTYMLDQKTAHQTHGHNSVKFQNSFSKSLCSKFAAKWLLMISPHFACYCTTSWNITVRKQAINDKLKLV